METNATAINQRWYEEVWNQKREDSLNEMLAPTCGGHMEGVGEICSADTFKEVWSRVVAAFPDLKLQIEDTATEGNKVVTRWVARATHTGEGLGIEPTQQSVEFRGMTWLEFKDGKIVRGWDHWDHTGLMMKLQQPA